MNSNNAIGTHTGGIIGGTYGITRGCQNEGIIQTTETNGQTAMNETSEEYFVGGIVGYTENTIQNCENLGNITSKLTEMPKRLCIGGIAGYSTGYLSTSNNSGEINQELKNTISRENNIGVFQGGIIGWKQGNTLENCKNTGKVRGSTTNVTTMWTGGILGGTWEETVISKCSNSALIESTATLIPQYWYRDLNFEHLNTGGIAGCIYSGSSLDQCFNVGNIKAELICGIEEYISGGGIAGECYGSIMDCYNKGTLEANNKDTTSSITIGGITGFLVSGGTLRNSYNTSANIFRSSSADYKKPKSEFKGLIVGYNDSSVSNSYYISSSNNSTYYATAGIGGGTTSGTTAKISSQLQGLASTLGNTYWASSSTINSGYPYLKNNTP